MSFLLTQEAASDALDMVLSQVRRLINEGVFGERIHLHVVIGKPTVPFMEANQDWWNQNGILWEGSIGDRELWKRDYQSIARSKCFLTWQWQKPTREIPASVLRVGDTIYYGSAILDNIPVGKWALTLHITSA